MNSNASLMKSIMVLHHGMTSSTESFVMAFSRPVASLDDDSIVANACESAPYQISTAVKKRDFFWAKH